MLRPAAVATRGYTGQRARARCRAWAGSAAEPGQSSRANRFSGLRSTYRSSSWPAVAGGRTGRPFSARPGSREAPGAARGQPAQRLPFRDDQAAQQRVGLDAADRTEALVHRRVRAGAARPVLAPDRAAQPVRQRPVQEGGRAIAVPDLKQQQPARFQHAGQPVQHQLGVLDAVQQQDAGHDVEGALRQGDGAQIAGRAPGQPGLASDGGPGHRLIVIDQADADVGPAVPQCGQVQVAGGGDGAGRSTAICWPNRSAA